MACRAGRALRAIPPTGMSGRVRETCCISTRNASPAFLRPGHAVTGIRDRTRAERDAHWGYEYAHSIVDDHSRIAYSELHPDQRATTVTGFVCRALDWYRALGVQPRRIMTDNAWAYTHNRSLAQLLAQHDIRHLRTRPHTPRTNGKVERFHRTMSREWA